MTTERLEEFRVLATVLNYSKAAERLYISQSILSRHIQELESELGVTLFARSKHSVALTDEGNFLLKWSVPILERTEQTLSAMQRREVSAEGQIHICYAEQSLNTAVLSFIRDFQAANPGLRLRMTPGVGMARKERLYLSDLTLTAVDYTDILMKDIEGTLLCTQQTLLAIPPFSRFGDAQEIRLEDLAGETLIVPFAEDLFGPYARNALLASRKCRNDLRRVDADSPEEALLKVELGDGIMLIPHHLKHRVYPHTRTVRVSDPDCRFPIILYRHKAAANPAAELFYEKMKESFRSK